MTVSSGAKFGVCSIGNAIVDIIAPASDDFIASQAEFGMNKGAMTLIDQSRAIKLYDLIGPATETSGGSAGNTMAAYASFGGKGAYMGKVANDKLGEIFTHDIRAIGVHFETTPLIDGKATAQCLILVTPDAHRTMNTFLGASTQFEENDIDQNIIANSEITYLEGYLFDEAPAKAAFLKAAECAHKNKRKLALSLSDPFCVNRHRGDFRQLVRNHVDILFANEEELVSLYETELSDAIEIVRQECGIIAVTRGAEGSIVISGDKTIRVPAETPQQVLDTTGAGDVYAAGFLFGLTCGESLERCGYLGSLAASEVIDHYGPRPLRSLKDMMQKKAA